MKIERPCVTVDSTQFRIFQIIDALRILVNFRNDIYVYYQTNFHIKMVEGYSAKITQINSKIKHGGVEKI